jgi:Plasmid pRiA4b ORF-3-like protein
MDLKPSVVSPALAAAALESPVMAGALRLAGWVGDGRPVTDSGVLRPADAVEACAALGVELPSGKKPRTAADLPELMEHWDFALSAGLIERSGKRVFGHDVQVLADDPAAALDAWMRAASADFGLPDEPCGDCLLTLVLVAGVDTGADVAVEDLAVIIQTAFEASLPPCPDCGQIHVGDEDQDPVEHIVTTLSSLRLLGAVVAAGEPVGTIVRLTPLGRMLADSVSALFEPAPEDSADAVVRRLGALAPVTAITFASPWLAVRTRVEAARELFDFAKEAEPRWRSAAFGLAGLLGPESLPAWQERAAAPGYGAYIRAWLEEHEEPAPYFPRDDVWLAADSLSAVFGQAPPESAAAAVLTAIGDVGDNLADTVKMLGESGHPDSAKLIELIRGFMRGEREAVAAVPADSRSYQLKITLYGVADPAVWRRVAVAGGATLEDLHNVIQGAMGWQNAHMHGFRAGRRELAPRTPLREALPRSGSHIHYEYDFGDGWEHEIRSEGFFQNEQGVTLPACLDGTGACPPEDCGGPWGYEHVKEVLLDPSNEEYEDALDWMGLDDGSDFDPAAFSLDEANKRLDWRRPRVRAARPAVEAPERPGVTVVRAQGRGKKSKAKRKR